MKSVTRATLHGYYKFEVIKLLIFVCCLNAYFNDRVTLSIKQHDYAFSAIVTLGGIVNWNNRTDREASPPSMEREG